MDKKEQFVEILKASNRPGIDNLIEYMEQGFFFESPCSTQHHLCYEGGLAEHSMNVYNYMNILNDSLHAGLPQYSIILVSLLHDLGKMGQYGEPNYIPNILKSGKQSEAKPYVTNPDLIYEEHEIRSVIIASKFIELTPEEQNAILHHNGLYGKLDSSFGSYYDKHPLSLLLHMADMWCCRVVEAEEGSDAE